MLPGDTLTRDGSLAFLSGQITGLHVGSKTALAWRGVRQNVAFREVVNLWGDKPKRLPDWFTKRFQAHYQADLAAKHSERIGGGKRWVAVGRTGERLDLRHP